MVAVAAGGVRCRNAGAVAAGGWRCRNAGAVAAGGGAAASSESLPQINALLQADVVEHCEDSSLTRSVHLAQHARRRS